MENSKGEIKVIKFRSFLREVPKCVRKIIGDNFFLYPVRGDGSCGLRTVLTLVLYLARNINQSWIRIKMVVSKEQVHRYNLRQMGKSFNMKSVVNVWIKEYFECSHADSFKKQVQEMWCELWDKTKVWRASEKRSCQWNSWPAVTIQLWDCPFQGENRVELKKHSQRTKHCASNCIEKCFTCKN